MRSPATIVRPSDDLLERLLPVLRQGGVEMRAEDVLAPETSEDQVMMELQRRRPELLVIPFWQPVHQGVRTDGVALLRRLERQAPEAAAAPVLLVATVYSAGAVRLLLGEANPDETLTRETRHRILVLQEESFGEATTASLVRMHLQLHRRTRLAY